MSTEYWLGELCPEIAEWQIELIVDHINEALNAEREACAKICEEAAEYGEGAWLVANRIRARGNDE